MFLVSSLEMIFGISSQKLCKSNLRKQNFLVLCNFTRFHNFVLNSLPEIVVTFESGPSKIKLGHYLGKRDPKRFSNDVNVVASEECITHHEQLVCDLKIRKLKNIRRKYFPKRKLCKISEDKKS